MSTFIALAVAMVALGMAGIELLARHLARQFHIERDEHEDGGP